MLIKVCQLFPLWATAIAVVAYYIPTIFTPFKPSISYLLMFVMFTMGVSLSFADFKYVFAKPKAVIVCTVLHYIVMPFTALILTKIFQMPTDLAVGMILVGSVSSGTASNVIIYLAKGDVALSVTISSVSTLVGVVVTPLLTLLLVGQSVQVNAWEMFEHIVLIVLVPIILGLIIHYFFNKLVKKVESILPFLSMCSLIFLIGIVVAASRGQIANVGVTIMLAIILHNAIGLLGGYWGGKLFGFDESTCRTMSIEVGMQNSALAATLGQTYFSSLASLPGAIFSVWHNISGSLLAGYWQGKPVKKRE
ncbi:bile acid:sodium symporter family protein [Entomomonas sp. E2T0]|nr:bile acid:sodium symporter family protein [Entomomonas sp. E2T0]